MKPVDLLPYYLVPLALAIGFAAGCVVGYQDHPQPAQGLSAQAIREIVQDVVATEVRRQFDCYFWSPSRDRELTINARPNACRP